MVPCISRKVGGRAVQSLCCYFVLIVLLNNFQCSASVLATTIASVVSPNVTGTASEPMCSAVKDIFTQRGIADKDLPANFPIKGETFRHANAWLYKEFTLFAPRLAQEFPAILPFPQKSLKHQILIRQEKRFPPNVKTRKQNFN